MLGEPAAGRKRRLGGAKDAGGRVTSRPGLPGRLGGYLTLVIRDGTPVPGLDGWSYAAFRFDPGADTRTVELVRDDGREVAFTVPELVSEPADLRAIAHIVVAACERWEDRQGVGG